MRLLYCSACRIFHHETKFNRDKNRKNRNGRQYRCRMSRSETRPRQVGKYSAEHFQAVEKKRRAERRAKAKKR